MSLVLGLGLEHSCPWPRECLSSERLSLALALASDFFCVLGLGLEPCVLDSTSAENNELKECCTSGLQNTIRPFTNCSNEMECQNRGNSAKKCLIFKTFSANGCRKQSDVRKLSKLKTRSGRIPKLERGNTKKGQSVL